MNGKPRDKWYDGGRLGGLRRFAAAITVFNLLGHLWFGFEQSYATPLVGLAAAYLAELLLEAVESWTCGRSLRFLGGGIPKFIDFLLPAHISGLACSMLLYAQEELAVVAFAATVAIVSKSLLRVPVSSSTGAVATRHFLNPSNFGIAVTLLIFPWVGIAPPYHFTENLSGLSNWLLPAFIICSGTFLNWRFTRRLPLIAAWVSGFFLQALLRHVWFDASLAAALLPMTGVAFILFTFYMVTDPPTTPNGAAAQIAFGASVAAMYGVLMALHVVFGLFFALAAVATVRGLYLTVRYWILEAGKRAELAASNASVDLPGMSSAGAELRPAVHAAVAAPHRLNAQAEAEPARRPVR
jgi:enediyne biosynthesis protein E5